jgi:hypothetical protein
MSLAQEQACLSACPPAQYGHELAYHSCNHRACPQCGKAATAEWVERELGKRVGAPYFMVTFTLPEELRCLFFIMEAKEIYHIFFAAASSALSDTLANPRWLGAITSGFTMILHTWNQRLFFHPHLHCIVSLLWRSDAAVDETPRPVASLPSTATPKKTPMRLTPFIHPLPCEGISRFHGQGCGESFQQAWFIMLERPGDGVRTAESNTKRYRDRTNRPAVRPSTCLGASLLTNPPQTQNA